ncbi:hypothetical protein U2057_15415, partial [Listeria monocytogenes]|uniref:hypothetical protein n=1 Tax=Listeria monocytogenes TaxID=1639 RepID=UPI002FDC0CD9
LAWVESQPDVVTRMTAPELAANAERFAALGMKALAAGFLRDAGRFAVIIGVVEAEAERRLAALAN